MRRWYFWQGSVSIHQAPQLAALARLDGGREVTAVCARGLERQRADLGWGFPSYAPARLVVAPSAAEIGRIVAQSRTLPSIHVFSGFSAARALGKAFDDLARGDAQIGFYAESGRLDRPLLAWLRRVRCRWQARRWRPRCDFFLGVGELGQRWYGGCGLPPQRIFPYAYFVDPPGPGHEAAQARNPDDPCRLIYVGELARHKGIDLLLRALAALTDLRWELDIVGGGRDATALRTLARDLGIAGRVRWSGALDHGAALRRIADTDRLILPSRHDGWGVAINEALHLGVPAIASDACGAACAIRHPALGRIFPTGSLVGLEQALAQSIAEGPPTADRRARIRGWAARALGAERGARYLDAIADYLERGGKRPDPPWEDGAPP